MKGRDLAAAFVEDTIRTMRTWPNAEAIYFLQDEDEGLRGAVRGSGDEIVFRFSAGELHRVSILSGTEGEYFEAEDIPEPFELEGYRWDPEIRPEKDLLLGGVVPHERFGQPPPPQTVTAREQLEKFPERVLEHAVWGMLPKTRMGRRLIRRLKVYAGEAHPHDAQQPKKMELA